MSDNFKTDLKQGLEAEKIVSEILTAKGILNFPLCQFDGATNGNGGPKIWGHNSGLVCPDLICFENGKAFFIEVKSKAHAREYETQKEYSLDANLYNVYLKVQTFTNCPVWLAFYDRSKKTVYLGKIDEYSRIWDGIKNGEIKHKGNIYYWDISGLKGLYKPRTDEIKSFL